MGAKPFDKGQYIAVPPHPGRKAAEVRECRIGVRIIGEPHDVAIDPCVGPVCLDRHGVESTFVHQMTGDTGSFRVEVVSPVRGLSDEHEPPIADEIDERVVIILSARDRAKMSLQRRGDRRVCHVTAPQSWPNWQQLAVKRSLMAVRTVSVSHSNRARRSRGVSRPSRVGVRPKCLRCAGPLTGGSHWVSMWESCRSPWIPPSLRPLQLSGARCLCDPVSLVAACRVAIGTKVPRAPMPLRGSRALWPYPNEDLRLLGRIGLRELVNQDQTMVVISVDGCGRTYRRVTSGPPGSTVR